MRPWPTVSLLVVLGARPDLLFDRFAQPALGQAGAELAVTSFEFLIAALIGSIGGRAYDWRITTCGVALMPAAIYFLKLFDYTVLSAVAAVELLSEQEALQFGALQFLLFLLPASLAHIVAELLSRRSAPSSVPAIPNSLADAFRSHRIM